jgi:hypothetical protein
MNILIINSINSRERGLSGGLIVSNNNILTLKKIFGINARVYDVPYYPSRLYSFLYSLINRIAGITSKEIKNIIKIIMNTRFDYIFLNTSRFGFLAKVLHKYNIPIITFFHNIEVIFYAASLENSAFLQKLLYHPMKTAISKSEKNIVEYSEKIITLNKRDASKLKQMYRREADFIIPMFFKDNYSSSIAAKYDKKDGGNKLLFVGADFFGNTEGLFWFIENCLDMIDADLLIVGNGMDKYKNKYSKKRAFFIGYVDSIDDYYYQTDAVVLPIISGSGMKTKTCEALMYGKTIFGTTEAFEGYDALDFTVNDWLCNTQEEFIRKVNRYLVNKTTRINNYSRKIFLENYSDFAIEKKFREIFIEE